jgi:hypothetical protein
LFRAVIQQHSSTAEEDLEKTDSKVKEKVYFSRGMERHFLPRMKEAEGCTTRISLKQKQNFNMKVFDSSESKRKRQQ